MPDSMTRDTKANHHTYALGMLTVAFTMNIVDRHILSILLEPIKQELHISDTYLGLLTGLSFGIFYSLVGVPIAMLADKGNRRNIIVVTLALFSAMTVLSGFVMNFAQLLLARIGVAVGEAGGSPASHSMISDMYKPEKRARALGIYTSAVNIGTLIGFLAGGWISQIYGWRMAFFVVGAPGLIVALIIRFTVREPARGHADGLTAQGQEPAPAFREVLKFLWNQHSFRHLATATTIVMIGGTACSIWLPAFFSRSFGMSSGETGTFLALMLGFGGWFGTYFGGHLADSLGKRDVRWNMWIVAIIFAISAPFWAATFLSHNKTLSMIFFAYPAIVMGAWMASSFAMTQALVTVRMRTRASALLFLIISLIGGGIGPQLTGILSDLYAPYAGSESLRYALFTVSFSFFWSAFHYYLAARTLKADIDHARSQGMKDEIRS